MQLWEAIPGMAGRLINFIVGSTVYRFAGYRLILNLHSAFQCYIALFSKS